MRKPLTYFDLIRPASCFGKLSVSSNRWRNGLLSYSRWSSGKALRSYIDLSGLSAVYLISANEQVLPKWG